LARSVASSIDSPGTVAESAHPAATAAGAAAAIARNWRRVREAIAAM
jgi:hypothetical protein